MSSVADNVPQGTRGQALSISIKTLTNGGGTYNVKPQTRRKGWMEGGRRRRRGREADRVRKEWR